MIKAGIVGGTGYTGVELLRLLAAHPDVEIAAITSRGEAGTPVARLHTTTYTEGGLLVEAIEPKTVRLLWSAFNRGTVKAADATPQGLAAIARETLADLPEATTR